MRIVVAPLTAVTLGLALSLGFSAATDTIAPAPIVVHDVHYEPACIWAAGEWEGCIAQDRTITPPGGGATFSALWAAEIVNADTGAIVPWCRGSGGSDYPRGRDTVIMPLGVWTGREECTLESLAPGTYQPRAVWKWGTKQETATGAVFLVP